jgi:hypothetical protein
MTPSRFDAIAKLLADRRLSRRRALAQAGAGLAAGALATTGLAGAAAHAQEATPAPTEGAGGQKGEYLFVQSFESGTIAPKAGAAGTYTLTLAHGLGQTLYFSDRPERVVGAAPTPQFLKGLGFSADNPPNAALVVEASPGDEDIAVLELYNPAYDEASHTATYDVKVLEEWQRTLSLGFAEAPTDLAQLAPAFGAAHLFIDDCPNDIIRCTRLDNLTTPVVFDNQPFCWNYSVCMPCEPGGNVKGDRCQTYQYWNQQCNAKRTCGGDCRSNVTTAGAICTP